MKEWMTRDPPWDLRVQVFLLLSDSRPSSLWAAPQGCLDALDNLDLGSHNNIFLKAVSLPTYQCPRDSDRTSWTISSKSSLNYT